MSDAPETVKPIYLYPIIDSDSANEIRKNLAEWENWTFAQLDNYLLVVGIIALATKGNSYCAKILQSYETDDERQRRELYTKLAKAMLTGQTGANKSNSSLQ